MALINKLNALGDLVREKTGKHTRIELHDSETFDVNLEVNGQFIYTFPAGTRSVLIKRLSKNLVVTHNLVDNAGNWTFVNFASWATEEVTLDNIEDGYKFIISNTKSSALTAVYEFINYDENGNIIQIEKEVKNTMTLDEMATELSNVETGGGSGEDLPAAEGSEF